MKKLSLFLLCFFFFQIQPLQVCACGISLKTIIALLARCNIPIPEILKNMSKEVSSSYLDSEFDSCFCDELDKIAGVRDCDELNNMVGGRDDDYQQFMDDETELPDEILRNSRLTRLLRPLLDIVSS